MNKYKLCFVTIIAAMTLAASAAFAQFGPSEPIVNTKTMLSVDKLRPGDKFEVAVEATVKDGYHIGAHDKDALYPAKLTLVAPKGIAFEDPLYPKAERKAFPVAPKDVLPVYEGKIIIRVVGHAANDIKQGSITIESKLDTQGCKGDQCYPPQLAQSKVKVNVVGRDQKIMPANSDVFKASAGTTSAGIGSGSDFASRLKNLPLFVQLLLLYGMGLVLAFTPCVYPMVPVTVGYFSTQCDSKNTKRVVMLASVYVLGLALTYSVLGGIAATTGGLFGAAMQSPAVIIGIAVVLLALALSMFGLYELRPPAFIENRASGRSGIIGALIMGLIFGIVAAPCVGPVVVGLLLFVAQRGNPVLGFIMFFVLALGIGTPLFFLAAFSAKLPVPGMWMVAVKKAAGFLLIGAAAHFVETLVPDSIGKLLIPFVILAAGIYFGFFERSLKSGKLISSIGKAGATASVVLAVFIATPHAPKSVLNWQPYSPESVAIAAKSGKPVMLDFTAAWCGICKELEHGPFSDTKIAEEAKNFQLVRVDGTDRNDPKIVEAVKKYKIQGFPTVIFFDKSGNEIKSARIIGYVDSSEMIKRMKSASES